MYDVLMNGVQMTRKNTIEMMQAIAKERGGQCLSFKYMNSQTPLEWECEQLHRWSAKPDQIMGTKKRKGTWCPDCGKMKLASDRMKTLSQVKQEAEKVGLEFIDSEYRGGQEKHLYACKRDPFHNPLKPKKPDLVARGQGCGKCAGNAQPSHEDLNRLARSIGKKNPKARCVSKNYKNSSQLLDWFCGVETHPIFPASYRSVKYDGTWCKECREAKEGIRYSELCRKLAAHLNARWEGSSCQSLKDTQAWTCCDGHPVQRSLESILTYRSFCKVCDGVYIKEDMVREVFAGLFDKPFKRVKNIPWLRNSKGNRMELDGYNEELSLAFEFQGEQHGKITYFSRNEEQLKERKHDDDLKVELCRKNGINLIIVPYCEWGNLVSYILSELSKINISPLNISLNDVGIKSSSRLYKLNEYVKRRHDGYLVSKVWRGSDQKLEFRCRSVHHGIYRQTPSAVYSGKWCRRCDLDYRSASCRILGEKIKQIAHANGWDFLGDELTMYHPSETVPVLCRLCSDTDEIQVKKIVKGKSCSCATNKKRITKKRLQEKLAARNFAFHQPDEFPEKIPGPTKIPVVCLRCKGLDEKLARNIANDQFGCENCKPNARVTLEKAHAAGLKNGFTLEWKGTEIPNSFVPLSYRCNQCTTLLEIPYRKMRNSMRCPKCKEQLLLGRLIGRVELD